jgi:hypothetical protein
MNPSRKTILLYALWFLWVGAALWAWLQPRGSFFPVGIEAISGLVIALGFWLLMPVLGWGIARRWFFAERPNPGDIPAGETATRLLVATGIGLGLYAAIVLAVGIWIGVSRPIFLVLHAVLVASGGRRWLTVGQEALRLASGIRARSWTRGEAGAAIILVLAAACTLPFALPPNLNPDTLRYHFGLTRIYETAGGIRPMPDFAESNISLNWQMLYLGILVVAGETAAQLFNWLALPFAVLAVALTVGSAARWFAAALLVFTPFLLAETALANNDLGMAFFCAAMWLAVSSRALRREWLLAGLFGGMAVGTKYPALLAVIGLAGGSLSDGSEPLRVRARWLGWLFIGVAAGYAPWLIRNLAWTGDPLYPTLSRWLPWASVEGRWMVDHYARELATYGAGMSALARFLLAPWRVTMSDEQYFESELGVLVWAALPLVFVGGAKTRLGRAAAVATAIFGILWATGPQVTRFLAAGIPGLVIAAAEGWRSLPSNQLRKGMAVILAGLMAINAWVACLVLAQLSDPFDFILYRLTAGEYLAKRSATYRMGVWLEQQPNSAEKVLLIGVDDNWFFYRLARVSGPFDRKWFIREANAARSPGELAERLKAASIRFICIDRARAGKLQEKFGYKEGFDPGAEQRFQQFVKECTEEVRRDGSCQMLRIR